jgi:ubiquinone/menaquinone biosynthesis C-methylase UbiE
LLELGFNKLSEDEYLMGFYEEFIEKYDKLISWESRFARESKFYQKLFSENKVESILDCACGTGEHVIMFNKMGYIAQGSDLSPAMVKKAKINSRKYKVKAVFKVSDFRKLTKTFDRKFDVLLCVGNSLPHLSSDRDLTKALKEMYNAMEDKGILVLQQRNYDMLVKKQKRFMPITIGKNESFFYVLDYYPNKIVFNVVNLENKTKGFNIFKTEYSPLKKNRLSKLLSNVGFKDMKYYGNYKFREFDIRNDDFLTIVCKKSYEIKA